MFVGMMLMSAMFTLENPQFVSAVKADLEAGKAWTYVGSQPPPENGVAIPVTSLTTGEDIVLFVTKQGVTYEYCIYNEGCQAHCND